MKTAYLTFIALLFFVKGYSQEIVKIDSTITELKTYLKKRILFPAVAMENNVQGTVVIGFKLDDDKNITNTHVIKSLSRECDAEALRVIQIYHKQILLPSAEYVGAITFLIEGKKRNSKVIPFDKSIYQNFLFDLNIEALFSD